MSVPQMPTRWTRTSASPGPGAVGLVGLDPAELARAPPGAGLSSVRGASGRDVGIGRVPILTASRPIAKSWGGKKGYVGKACLTAGEASGSKRAASMCPYRHYAGRSASLTLPSSFDGPPSGSR